MHEEKEFQQRVQKIEALVRKIEQLADPDARASAVELFKLVMDLHGAGLERMLDIAFEAGDAGRSVIDKFARDDLVGSLLLLYGLHPLDLETRVIEALDRIGPSVRSHGGKVELLGINDGVVRLRLEVSPGGCGSTSQTLKAAVEEAIYDAAPDIAGLEVEGGTQPQFSPGLVQLAKSSNKR
ncbi:MAG TPA: NifU family protein [Blastocatellia bacterium]|nr:NifU family protein [Blastocatellia bacterium]